MQRVCPMCKRDINIEHGRWSRHTDPTTWSLGRGKLRQCEMAERRFVPLTDNQSQEG